MSAADGEDRGVAKSVDALGFIEKIFVKSQTRP